MLEYTYEVGSTEFLHPDVSIAIRMVEDGVGDCGYGCKIYADPMSSVRVLGHNRGYGCPK